jgi:hypothetical protein
MDITTPSAADERLLSILKTKHEESVIALRAEVEKALDSRRSVDSEAMIQISKSGYKAVLQVATEYKVKGFRVRYPWQSGVLYVSTGQPGALERYIEERMVETRLMRFSVSEPDDPLREEKWLVDVLQQGCSGGTPWKIRIGRPVADKALVDRVVRAYCQHGYTLELDGKEGVLTKL